MNKNLITCIKCEHIVSVHAKACPGCQSEAFAGTICNICMGRLDVDTELQIGSRYYHLGCIMENFAAQDLCCVDCGTPLTDVSALLAAKNEIVCAHCGSCLPFGDSKCLQCGLPFITGTHKISTSIYKPEHSFCGKHRQDSGKKSSK